MLASVTPTRITLALPAIRAGAHALLAVLLAVTVVDAVAGPRPDWAVLGTVAVLAVVYAAGFAAPVRRGRAGTPTWGALLTTVWILLVAQTAVAVWLAFPLFFLAVHVLPTRLALPVVAFLTAVAVGGFAWHRERLEVGGVLGPVLGALVAVATVLGVRAAAQQSEARGALEERDRLARESHDTIAQGLNSIHLLLGAAEQQLGSRPERAAELVAQARATAAENLEEARRLVRALGPADLATRSLPEALRRLADRHPAVRFTVSGTPVPLGAAVDVALLRIAQEAVANAVRHADAERIAVTLSYLGDEVALDVVDDGNGRADARNGFGIGSMRRRAEELGGSFVVESTPGSGTAVAVTVPAAGP
jgi:signal transduction histidine kinase